jgi:hypothetical protein
MRKTTFALLITAMLTLALAGCTVADHTPSWGRLDASSFPAHVRAVRFADGGVIDDGHSLRVGNWTVAFGSAPVTADLCGIGSSCLGVPTCYTAKCDIC